MTLSPYSSRLQVNSIAAACRLVVAPVVLFLLGTGLSSAQQQLSTPPFFNTSFDCSKAKSMSIEEAICKNEKLAHLDVEATEAYRKRLDSTNASEKEHVIASQRRWLTIRNAHGVNPYHGDPPGEIADLESFYQERIAALRSDNPALLKTAIPEEYAWLQAIAPAGLSKNEFGISRAYAGCEDPCQKKPSLYRWISIGGGGIGEEPGDVDTPHAQITKKLASEGWVKCRSASDSGKPTIDYFSKGNKIVSIYRYYSMGVGNGIGLGVTISDPLPQSPAKPTANPAVAITGDWIVYASPDVGLRLRYPPDWNMKDETPPSGGTQYKDLLFGADDSGRGDFRVTVEPEQSVNDFKSNDEATRCFPSSYRISGFPAIECVTEDEVVSEGVCQRQIRSVAFQTGKYDVTFEPASTGSFADESDHYTLLNLYERIMSTIEMKQPK